MCCTVRLLPLTLPRFLEAACAMPADAPPRQRGVLEGALNLAIRLGLPDQALLGRLLDPAAGPGLYERFRRVVRTACPGSSKSQTLLHALEIILSTSVPAHGARLSRRLLRLLLVPDTAACYDIVTVNGEVPARGADNAGACLGCSTSSKPRFLASYWTNAFLLLRGKIEMRCLPDAHACSPAGRSASMSSYLGRCLRS